MRGCGEMWKGVRVRVRLRATVERFLRAKARNACVRKGTCSLSDTEGKAKVFAFVSMGADAKSNTRGDGAQQLGDLRLLKDGGERGGALVSDLVKAEAANEEQSTGMQWKSKRVNGR